MTDIFSKNESMAALAISTSVVLYGFAKAYSSTGKPIFMDNLFLPDQNNIKILYCIMPMMSIFSSLVGGYLIEEYGRKKIIYLQCYVYFFGFIVMAEARTLIQTLIGRAICGFCNGIIVLGASIYLIEILQPETRGILSVVPVIIFNLTQMFVDVLNFLSIDWNLMGFIGCLFCAISLLALMFIPDSPRWYYTHERDIGKADLVLVWLRPNIEDAEFESKEMVALDDIANMHNFSYAAGLIKIKIIIIIPVCLMFLQQILRLNEYELIPGISFNLQSVISSLINIIGAIICMMFIERLGRKIILILSFELTCITLFIAIQADFFDSKLILTFVYVLYKLSISIGLNIIPWLLMGEIAPNKYRSFSCSLATSANFIGELIMKYISFNPEYGIGWLGNTILIIVILAFGTWFLIMVVPETGDRSLEEIEYTLMYASLE